MSFEIGKRLQTLTGDVKVVRQNAPAPIMAPEALFNLEVYNEHVCCVGHEGVLVHIGRECDDGSGQM